LTVLALIRVPLSYKRYNQLEQAARAAKSDRSALFGPQCEVLIVESDAGK
jgi:hypothetical protein